MRSLRSFWRSGCLFIEAILVLTAVDGRAWAAAQDDTQKPVLLAAADDIPRTMRRIRQGAIVGAPSPDDLSDLTEPSGTTTTAPRKRASTDDSPYADVLALASKFTDPKAPPWVFVPKLGLKEIFTDNVKHTDTHHIADLISEFSVGATVSADTPRLQGLLNYTVSIRRAIHDADESRIPQVGFLTAHLTAVPNLLFLDLHGIAHEIERQGLGVEDSSTLTNKQSTQAYAFSASPDLKSKLGNFADADLRYVFNQAWFNRNTGATNTAGGSLGPLGDANQQEARGDLKLAGTMLDRLMSDVSFDATYNQTTKLKGIYRKDTGLWINEYQLTRSISAIGVVGYQSLSDHAFSDLNGEGAIWDGGLRWKPNADSSFLILYGRQDLKNDISGEIQWRFTPTTNFYAAYTDSITNSQQSLVNDNEDSLLGEEGPAVGVTYGESPVIATLNGRDFGRDTQPQAVNIGSGLPLTDVNSFIPAENGIFRRKLARGILYTDVAGQAFSVTLLHAERIALAGTSPPDLTSRKVVVAWLPVLTENLTGRAAIGYADQDIHGEQSYNMSVGIRYSYSETFESSVQYSHVQHFVVPKTGDYAVNALTIRMRKLF